MLGLNPEESALIGFLHKLQVIWNDEELTFREKVVKSVHLVVETVTGLIESINAWWTGQAVKLARKAAELLGLDPDKLWIVKFLEDLNAIWESEKLTFSEKVVESLRLIPGAKALEMLHSKLKEVWASEDLTLGEKVVETLDLSLENATVRIVLAALAAVSAWKIAPAVYASLAGAISAGVSALAAGGLVLGKIAIASLILL